ncbi:MAG: leucine-rich repeat domain-containing protein [Lachnospiraceae bacterium]|nr:leucine-rich repeat domain-containing protein [Lachnospiraceae bacterium]
MSYVIKNGILKEYIPPETEIVISDGVTSIGDHAFEYCGLRSIRIPDSVTSIGDHAFEYCRHLQTINIPESVTHIGRKAFLGCTNLQSIYIPNGVTKIEAYSFGECGIRSITIPNSVKSIGEGAFEWCKKLRSVTIPDSVKNIGYNAFHLCEDLRSITIPDSVIYIAPCAFQDTKITFTSNNFKISFFLYDKWYENDSRSLGWFYNQGTDFNRITPCFKYPMALLRFFGHNENEYRSYIKRNIVRVSCWVIDANDCGLMGRILAAGFVTKSNIDRLIDYSIEKKRNEMTDLLSDYKTENFGE